MNSKAALTIRILLAVCACVAPVGTASALPDTGSASGSSGSGGSPSTGGIQGRWSGTWTVTSGVYPGTLDVGSESPLRARIEIPSRPCVADWVETGRSGSVVTVRATVVSGSCVDNTWRLTLGSGVITGSDPENSRNSVVFTR